MPWSNYFNSRSVRWTLGAHDILFKNPLVAPLFSNGQVIETFRGEGIYQPALDLAIQKLDEGRWIHIFPEGKVNQAPSATVRAKRKARASSDEEEAGDGERTHELVRFRWGVSRLLMEAKTLPWIVPLWLQGFDRIMPEERPFPRPIPRLIPRPSVSITVGSPLSPSAVQTPLLHTYRSSLSINAVGIPHLPQRRVPRAGEHPGGWRGDTRFARDCRIETAEWLRGEVERLGMEARERRGDGVRGGREPGFGGPGVQR